LVNRTLSAAAAVAIGAGTLVAAPAQAAPAHAPSAAAAHAATWHKTRTRISSYGATARHIWLRGHGQVYYDGRWLDMSRASVHIYWKWPHGKWHHAGHKTAGASGYVKLWAPKHRGAYYKLHVFKHRNGALSTRGSSDAQVRYR
jgi:hypothetical protein